MPQIEDHHHNQPPDKPDLREAPPDFPAESFQLRKEDELDWFDRNAFYFNERKESQKGYSNPNSFSSSTSNHNLNPNSSSQRFSFNFTSNTSIIGLLKPQISCFPNRKSRRHCRPPRPRFFPKKPSRSGKSVTATVTEPTSPQVSCIGRVMSNKGKNRRCSSGRRRESTEGNSKTENKTGFWACLKAILRSRRQNEIEERQRPKDPDLASLPRWSFAERERKISVSAPLGEPPGLGGMKRFVSGRRSESWSGTDLDLVDSVVDSDVPNHQHGI